MNKLYQKYISFLYIKNFFIIFLALEFFYVGIDLLSNIKDLPTSANLQLLYIFYNAQIAANYTLPLSLVFAMISLKFSMIRSNELISFYTSGISKNQIIYPILLSSLFFTFVLICLNFTSFAQAAQFRSNILHFNKISNDTTNLFVKYNDQYVYFRSLNPLKKIAKDIKIFNTEKGILRQIITSKQAVFRSNIWELENANIITLPKNKTLGSSGLKSENVKKIFVLRNFKPNIIDTIHDGTNTLNAYDGIDAYLFLQKQNADTTSVRANVYSLVIFPLFAPFMLCILFFYMPAIGRFFNIAFLGFIFIFITLCIWGIVFVASKFAANGVLLPEIAILLPIVVLAFYSFFLFFKHR